MSNNNRLSPSFHYTFIPERLYMNAMMNFAYKEKSGDYQVISAETGIPMGESTGKVPAILNYCIGARLIELKKSNNSSEKKPILTPFGQIVLEEDPFLKEEITQWSAHFNLCDKKTGADIWFYTFFEGAQYLGMNFKRASLEKYLQKKFTKIRSNLIGPLIRTYEDEAAFGTCSALHEIEDTIKKTPAPLNDDYGWAYTAWVADLLLAYFPNDNQVTLKELNKMAGWQTIQSWNDQEMQHALKIIERKGILEIDRQMNPWIIKISSNPENLWKKIYIDLI